MLLENDVLLLRALEPEDLAVLYKWENDTTLWKHGNTLTPYSKLALRDYITEAQQRDIYQAKQLRLMIILKATEEIIGTIDLFDFDFHNNRAGVGILIDEDYRNKGYAQQTLHLLDVYVFDFLYLNQIYAYIAADNTNSIGLFEKAGYEKAGILNKWIREESEYKDVYIYQLQNKRNLQ